jgi:hypothetical protein
VKVANLYWALLGLVATALLCQALTGRLLLVVIATVLVGYFFFAVPIFVDTLYTELQASVMLLWSSLFLLLAVRTSRCRWYLAAGLCFGLLNLHAAIDHREHLTLLHPVPGIHRDAHHLPTFANDTDRHRAARSKGTGRFDFARNHGLARGNDRHRRRLRIVVTDSNRFPPGQSEITGNQQQQHEQTSPAKDQPARNGRPGKGAHTGEFGGYPVGSLGPDGRFVIHCRSLTRATPRAVRGINLRVYYSPKSLSATPHRLSGVCGQ